jgi:hypothetical protein
LTLKPPQMKLKRSSAYLLIYYAKMMLFWEYKVVKLMQLNGLQTPSSPSSQTSFSPSSDAHPETGRPRVWSPHRKSSTHRSSSSFSSLSSSSSPSSSFVVLLTAPAAAERVGPLHGRVGSCVPDDDNVQIWVSLCSAGITTQV